MKKYGRQGVINIKQGGNTSKKYTTLTAQEVIEFIEWAYAHEYYKLGNTIRKQTLGLPMGLSLAPPGANSLAICDMEKFALRNPNIYRRLCLLRYVDDILGIIAYDCKIKSSKETAIEILDNISGDATVNKQAIFYAPLKLKVEKMNKDHSTDFLEIEASLKHDGKDVRIRFKSKNETVPDKFKTIVPPTTFTTRQQKIAKLIGAFCRVYNNSPNVKDDSHNDLLSSLAIVATEFGNNGYPNKLINTALRSIYHKTNDTRLEYITFPFETIINK